jgi:hypothetical protein
MTSVITLEISDGFIPSVMFPRETFFLARAYPSVIPSVCPSVGVFLFATELAMEMGFTDDCYTDGRVPSVSPSICFSPTDFIAVTDGMSPSVKLDNVVVTVII